MEPIIEVKNVGKKYRIAHETERYLALRDVLANIFKSPLSFLKKKAKQITGIEKNEDFWALKDISFEIRKGEILGIIGMNGAGKSTLLKILSQITPPTTGEIKIRGRVGSLLEVGTGFHPELTGRENIFLNGAILGMRRSEIIQKFDKIVTFAGIDKFLDTPVKYYSSGMYVRLAFSVAAHMEPDVLIVDEVLAVGDVEFQKKCLGKMEEVTRAEGRTVLFVSHNMGAIQSLCNKCLLLEKGKIKMIGETNKVVSEYLQMNKDQGPTLEIRESQHVRGTKEAQIKKVSIGNETYGLKNHFLINEKITFDIDYEIKAGARKLSFWFLFTNQYGNIVMSSFQKDDKVLIKPEIGQNKITADFTNIGLLPGQYNVTIGIFGHNSETAFEFADWVEQAQFFTVEEAFENGEKFDNRLGMISSRATWKTNL